MTLFNPIDFSRFLRPPPLEDTTASRNYRSPTTTLLERNQIQAVREERTPMLPMTATDEVTNVERINETPQIQSDTG